MYLCPHHRGQGVTKAYCEEPVGRGYGVFIADLSDLGAGTFSSC